MSDRKRIKRVREDLSPIVPSYMRSTQCHYLSLETVGSIPEGLSVACRWGNQYDRAYTANGDWFLVFDDRKMPIPDGVQVRRGLYEPV